MNSEDRKLNSGSVEGVALPALSPKVVVASVHMSCFISAKEPGQKKRRQKSFLKSSNASCKTSMVLATSPARMRTSR